MISKGIIEAERLLSVTFWNNMSSWSTIDNLRRVAGAGFPSASEIIARTEAEWAEQPVIQRMFQDQDLPSLVDRKTKRCLADAEYAVHAACLVFAHSIVDATVYDYCRVSALACPSDWWDWIKDKNVKIAETKDKTLDELCREKVEAHLAEDIEKASLIKKVDRFLAICKPAPGWLPKDLQLVYRYDRGRLKRLDELRHTIVHQPGCKTLGSLDSDLFFLRMTLFYLFELTQSRYGIKVNLAYVFGDSG